MSTLTPTQVVSSKPIGSLSPEERKKRYAALKAKMGRSRLAVTGKSGVHYFWAPVQDRNEMARLDGLGYSIVREPDAKKVLAGEKKPEIVANGLKEDGTYVVGDVILTQCPEEVYEFILMANDERHEEFVAGAKNDFLTGAEQRGVPVFETEGKKK